MSRRRVIESEDEEDSNSDSQTATSVSSSPRRRSRRISRRSAHSSSLSLNEDESDETEDSEESDDAHNLNRSRNHNQNNRSNRNQPPPDEFEDESSEDDIKEDDEPEEIPETHPIPSHFLPTPLSKLPPRYEKVAADITEVALPRLIDIATDLSEYNGDGEDYRQLSQRLQETMESLLTLSKQYHVESLMLNKINEQIGNGEIDDNKEDNCPIVTGDWESFLDTKRHEMREKIENNPGSLDGREKRTQQKINRLQSEYEQQFKDAIQRDDIEDPDDSNHNNNNRNSDDESDEDIVVDKSSAVGSIKCPLTTKVFEKPVKSKECGHTFEKEAILEYVRGKNRRGERALCPLPGCSKSLAADGFMRDVKIEKLIRAQKKQKEQEESEEDQFDFTIAD